MLDNTWEDLAFQSNERKKVCVCVCGKKNQVQTHTDTPLTAAEAIRLMKSFPDLGRKSKNQPQMSKHLFFFFFFVLHVWQETKKKGVNKIPFFKTNSLFLPGMFVDVRAKPSLQHSYTNTHPAIDSIYIYSTQIL